MTVSNLDERAVLERRANVVRSRLLRTLDALDQRRHQVADVRGLVKRELDANKSLLAMGAGAVALAIAGVGLVGHWIGKRRAPHGAERARVALATWLRPPPPERPSFVLEALRKTAISVTVLVATEAAKRAMTGATKAV